MGKMENFARLARLAIKAVERDRYITNYIKKCNIKFISEDEERELFERYHNGDMEAYHRIYMSCLPKVLSIASEYDFERLDFNDFFQAGAIGLIKAVENFDLSRGCKFSTYADSRIRWEIFSMLANESRIIRVPQYIFLLIDDYHKLIPQFFAEYGRTPTKEEVMEKLEITSSVYEYLQKALMEIVPFDVLLPSKKEVMVGIPTMLSETIEDTELEDACDIVYRDMLGPWACEVLESLTEEETIILKRSYGFDGVEEDTLSNIGKDLGKTGEAIRQNKKKVLERLKVSDIGRSQLEDERFVNLNKKSKEEERREKVKHVINYGVDEKTSVFSDLEYEIAGILFGVDDAPKTVNKVMNLECLFGYSDEMKRELIDRVISKYVKTYKKCYGNVRKKKSL